MTNAEIKAHWCYIKDLLNCEIPDGTMLTKDQHIERVGFHYVTAMRHGVKHCLEDFGKTVDEPLVDNISVSGDRVKSEASNIGSSWDEAKREPHVYSDAEGDDEDDSVIKTQEECARRFAHCENCD